jgi:iron complex transport system permease protein
LGLRPLALVGLLAALVGVFLLSLAIGSVNIPFGEVVTILLGGEPERATWSAIVLKFRLPKALTATLAGAALSVSGLQMQTLFRNPLADPFVLGISSGASLGVALVVLTVGMSGSAALLSVAGLLSNVGLVAAACIGAGVVMGAVLLLAQYVRHSVTLLIIGLMIGYLANSIVSLLIYFSAAERLQAYISWSFGSFGGVTWQRMHVLAPTVILGVVLALVLSKTLNALLPGETYAASMGVRVRVARFWIITSSAVLAGSVTAFCGPIAFLGIAVPHFCRGLLNTSDHRILVPSVTMMGAICALLADLVAQWPGSETVLPVNTVTSLLGAPVVVWILLRRSALKTAFPS